MSLKVWAIIHTVVGVLAILPAFGLQVAAVMGGASVGASSIGMLIAALGFIFPFFLIAALIAVWPVYLLRLDALTIAVMVAPWLYLVVLLGMIASVLEW